MTIDFEDLEKIERGVYAGSEYVLLSGGLKFHVELIEVTFDTIAVNSAYQKYVDDWLKHNEDGLPQLYWHDGRSYFCNISVFAK